MYTIKQISEKLKINANAIRFYEKRGLIRPIRGENNYREFDAEDISRLEIIILYRKMGFSVNAIETLLKDVRNETLLSQFAAQYTILNQHIHTMVSVRKTLGECIEQLLNQDGMSEKIVAEMEETAQMIAASNEWEDKWDFDTWAEDYDRDIRSMDQALDFYGNYDLILEKTAGYAGSGRKHIVEIGIGTGNLACTFLEHGVREQDYTGVDQSVSMLKAARRKCPGIRLRIGTFLQLPLEDHMCDTVVTSYAFHHCSPEEKRYAVLEMERILGEGGRIVITDLMFADAESRRRYEKRCTPQQKAELEDEYFGNVDEVEGILRSREFVCTHEQIDELIWVIAAKK